MKEGSALELVKKSLEQANQELKQNGYLSGNPNSDMAKKYFQKPLPALAIHTEEKKVPMK